MSVVNGHIHFGFVQSLESATSKIRHVPCTRANFENSPKLPYIKPEHVGQLLSIFDIRSRANICAAAVRCWYLKKMLLFSGFLLRYAHMVQQPIPSLTDTIQYGTVYVPYTTHKHYCRENSSVLSQPTTPLGVWRVCVVCCAKTAVSAVGTRARALIMFENCFKTHI